MTATYNNYMQFAICTYSNAISMKKSKYAENLSQPDVSKMKLPHLKMPLSRCLKINIASLISFCSLTAMVSSYPSVVSVACYFFFSVVFFFHHILIIVYHYFVR